MRVLLVEDDAETAKIVSMILRSIGAVSDQTGTGEDALALARHYEYDVILLDLVLPDMEGYEVVRKLRTARLDTPVVILSGLSRPEAKVRGLGAGADDFVTKPFNKLELLARMQAVLRRSKGLSEALVRLGEVEINLGSKEVTVGDLAVHLTAKEYQILELLALRRGTVLPKEAFLNHLYNGMDEPEMKIVDVFICKIRKKFAAAGVTDLITTSWGRGYTISSTPPRSTRAPEPAAAAGVVPG